MISSYVKRSNYKRDSMISSYDKDGPDQNDAVQWRLSEKM